MARRLLDHNSLMSVDARNTARAARFARARGFTLIELMIVVAIVGILSTLAILGYRRLTHTAKSAEATHIVSAIRIAQEDFKVERGIYADIGLTPCPRTGLDVPLLKTQWQPTCSGGTNTWQRLPVHTDGPVQFGYVTFSSGAPANTMANFTPFVTVTAIDTARPWYVIQAMADLDGLGAPYTQVEATSGGNQIYVRNDGQ